MACYRDGFAFYKWLTSLRSFFLHTVHPFQFLASSLLSFAVFQYPACLIGLFPSNYNSNALLGIFVIFVALCTHFLTCSVRVSCIIWLLLWIMQHADTLKLKNICIYSNRIIVHMSNYICEERKMKN
jgi:hypothetical protein